MSDNAVKRFHAKCAVHPSTGCWNWTGTTNGRGYGQFWPNGNGSMTVAHRYSYELHRGPVPDGLEIDHTCRNRGCVNPAHLELVTHAENVRRGWVYRSRSTWPTHCRNGHKRTAENTDRDYDGYLRCLICKEAG